MTAPVKLNLKVYQGSTYRETLRWETSEKVYTPIVNITRAAPMVVTATAHGAPAGWRVKITNCLGMTQANTSDYIAASAVTTDSLTFNSVNSLSYTAYTTSGVLEYNKPVDLTGYTARMQLREKITSSTTLLELTSANGGVVLDNANKTITIIITATQTAELNFNTAVYNLELVSNGGEVTSMLYGSVSLIKEVTR
jgi:hypothetical protein